MAFEDLCTIQDIKKVYRDLPTELNSHVKNNIPDATREVYQDAKKTTTPTDEDELYNMKKACVYKVLVWLEETGEIQPRSGNIASMGDGDFSISFAQSGGNNGRATPKTNQEQYSHYISKLLPLPPIASRSNY